MYLNAWHGYTIILCVLLIIVVITCTLNCFISEMSRLKVTHITCMHDYKLHLAEDDTATYLRCLKIQSL